MANLLNLFQAAIAEIPSVDGCSRRPVGDDRATMLQFPCEKTTSCSWPWVMRTFVSPLSARILYMMPSGTLGTIELGVSIALVTGKGYTYDTENVAAVTVPAIHGDKAELVIPLTAIAGANPGDSIRVRLRNLFGTATAAGHVYVSSLALEDST